MAEEVRTVPLDSLRLDEANARKHGQKSIDVLMESLAEFGQPRNIVIDDSGKIIAGNGIVMAAARLGWTEIRATVVDFDDRKARAYALVDNKTAEMSEWADPIVDMQLEELEDLDMQRFGFDPKQDDRLASYEMETWDASEIELETTFVVTAPIDQQPEIRKALEKFDVAFEEGFRIL